jgi:hypothetical protein
MPSRYTVGLVNVILKLVSQGAMGILGLYFSSKIGFKDILNDEIKQIKYIFLVIFTGIIMGVYFIGYDTLLRKIFDTHIFLYNYSTIPSAIFASFVEGIGDQILQMLRISFLVWLFSKLIKSENGRNALFWVVAVACALGFAIGHITSTFLYRVGQASSVFRVPFHEVRIILGVYVPLALVCAYFLKRFGLLSAIIIHFITDISWRVLLAYIMMGDIMFM